MEIKIRVAGKDDFLWLSNNDIHISENTLKSKLESKEIYIVEDNNTIIGWLRYNLFWDSIPFINMIFFLEDFRNLGIGKQLLQYWENEMQQNGYKNALTSTQSNEEAQHFFRKMGYKEIGGFKYFDDPYEIMFLKEF